MMIDCKVKCNAIKKILKHLEASRWYFHLYHAATENKDRRKMLSLLYSSAKAYIKSGDPHAFTILHFFL